MVKDKVKLDFCNIKEYNLLNQKLVSAVPSEVSDVSNLSNLSLASSGSTRSCSDDQQQLQSAANTDSCQLASNSGAADDVAGTPNKSSDQSVGKSDKGSLHKAYLIAKELLTTEIHYVSKLHLIDQVKSCSFFTEIHFKVLLSQTSD